MKYVIVGDDGIVFTSGGGSVVFALKRVRAHRGACHAACVASSPHFAGVRFDSCACFPRYLH
jgi:hypothetical protein